MPLPSNKVIVLVISHKASLDPFEEISLKQCQRVLGGHPIRLVCPAGLDLAAYRRIVPELQADFIPPHWLASYQAFNRLKILPYLYRRYRDFEFVLFYELDAFVFRDELLDWCAQDWDLIGAPWFEKYDLAQENAKPAGTGNGGFSLRRTASMLRVSRTWRYQEPASQVVRSWREGRCSLKWALANLTFRNNFFAPFNNFMGHEDVFWGKVASRRFPWLRVAPYEVARRFSFEVNPSRLYSECNNTLPFGCHKWMKFEPHFWSKHFEHFGYNISLNK